MIGVFKKLFELLSHKDRWNLGALVGAMILGAFLEMLAVGAVPAFVALLSHPQQVTRFEAVQVLQGYLGLDSHKELVFAGAVALALVYVVKSAYQIGLIYLEARYSLNRQVSLVSRLFMAYLQSSYTFHLQRNTAELLRNTCMEARRAVTGVLIPGLRLTRGGLVMVAILSLLFVTEPLLTLLALVVLGGSSGAIYRLVRPKLAAYGRQQQKYEARMLQSVNQGLGGYKTAKLLGREAYFANALTQDAKGYAQAARFRMIVGQIPRSVIQTVGILGVVAVAVVLIASGRPMGSVVTTLTLMAAAVNRLIPTFNQVTTALTKIRYNRYAVDVVHKDLQSLELERARSLFKRKPDPFPLHSTIELADLHYRYPGASEMALQGISVEIPRGKAVAFVGPSGSGKTTVVNAILGLLTPARGAVRVDGVDTQENLSGWQRELGYIPQDIYLSDDTVRRNIAFGVADDEIVEENIHHAIASARLQELIDSLPEGLDTMVGERGVRLSGGQRQRIGIARALYHDPQVLVMDEATSHLDTETERYVMEAIEGLRGERTLIIIAHRLSTVRSCDQLFLLKNRRLEAVGTYDELLQQSRSFQAIAV